MSQEPVMPDEGVYDLEEFEVCLLRLNKGVATIQVTIRSSVGVRQLSALKMKVGEIYCVAFGGPDDVPMNPNLH